MKPSTIRLDLLIEFLFTKGFQRLTWCGGKMTCYGANHKAWTAKTSNEDKDLKLTWALIEAALEEHDQPFTVILGAHPPKEQP